MPLRSLLFVPGDSQKKQQKALETNADVLILDLEDSVASSETMKAREMVRSCLDAHPPEARSKQLWVRINPIPTSEALDDLAAIVGGGPDVIILPKSRDGGDVGLLDHYLTALEVREGVPRGAIGIVPVVTETPNSLLQANSYVGCSERLTGLTWGAEDLSAALFASHNKTEDGAYEFTYRFARSVCLLAARAAGVEPIDTIWVNFRDSEGLTADATYARRFGFSSKFAIHPDQVDVINAAFTPSDGEIAHARAVVEAFAKTSSGTVGLNGQMLDKPHLKQAQQILSHL